MKITNNFALPEPIVKAIQNDPYSKGEADYSVSDLLQPPRKLALTRKHWDSITEDASDRVWSLFGQAVHHIAERAGTTGVVERRLSWKFNGITVSGQMDYYTPVTGMLVDYKVTTVSKINFKDFQDWEEQQNCYAELLRLHNEPISYLYILALIRDHRPKEAKTAKLARKPYPEKVEVIELPLWSQSRTQGFIYERIRLHEEAKKALPLCTISERWASSGISRRCKDYCSVNKFCDQFKGATRGDLSGER